MDSKKSIIIKMSFSVIDDKLIDELIKKTVEEKNPRVELPQLPQVNYQDLLMFDYKKPLYHSSIVKWLENSIHKMVEGPHRIIILKK
jgi:hypothetical protein